jgi:hypothetical protein
MGIDLALNLVLATLLVAVIVYAWRLHKRLGTWREGKAELDRTVKEFNEAAKRAEAAIADLKIAGEAAGRLLEDQTRKAVALKDDLEYVVSCATSVADRAVEAPRGPRARPEPVASGDEDRLLRDAIKFAEREGAERQNQRSQAEQELLKAIADRRRGAAVALASAAAVGTAMGNARAARA